MALTMVTNSVKDRINAADLNQLASLFRTIRLGDILLAEKQFLARKAPAVNAYNLSTVQCITLPDDAKAYSLTRVYARAGTAGTGEMTIAAVNATPTTGQVAITPNGDIGFLGTDAITDVDVMYEPMKMDVIELTLPVVPGTGVCAIPTVYTAAPRGIVMLLEAESLAGTLVAKMIVLANGSAPATTKANLSVAKSQVQFAVADAVTLARVKLGLVPAVDLSATLTTLSTY